MEISGREVNGWSLFELDGSFDLHSIHDIKNLFKHLCHQPNNIIFDFSKVKKIDSSGISCLLYGQKLLKRFNKEFRITRLKNDIKIIFQVTRGFESFDIFDEIEKAAESIEKISSKQVA